MSIGTLAQVDTQCGARNNDFGVKTTRGFRATDRPLRAQDVEERGGSRGVGDAEVAVHPKVQEPLDSGRTVFGALPLVPVGQKVSPTR